MPPYTGFVVPFPTHHVGTEDCVLRTHLFRSSPILLDTNGLFMVNPGLRWTSSIFLRRRSSFEVVASKHCRMAILKQGGSSIPGDRMSLAVMSIARRESAHSKALKMFLDHDGGRKVSGNDDGYMSQ